MKYLLLTFITIIFWNVLFPQSAHCQAKKDDAMVDSVLQTLTTDQKIAQLLVIRAYSDRDSVYNDSIAAIIGKWNVGGICFFRGGPHRQVALTNYWQKAAATPLMICTDAERGLGMRLDSAFSFPRQMTLGATGSDSLAWLMGSAIGKDCRRVGVNVNLAPVVDINSNPLNPVISTRSFGQDKLAVTRQGLLLMNGLQDQGIMATAKHFPGHGDTDTDSHLLLPVISKTKEQLDSVELFPFREMISHNVRGIMAGHLYLPAYDSGSQVPATLSYNVVTKLLREKMGFTGFIITDALDMQGVTKLYKPGEIEVKALLAGNDILLLPQDVEKAVIGICTAIDSAMIPLSLIDEKCRNILVMKQKAGLFSRKKISLTNLEKDLHPVSSELLSREIYRKGITLAGNQYNLIPMNFLDRRKIAVLSAGETETTSFQETTGNYAPASFFNISLSPGRKTADSLLRMMSPYNLVIIGIHKTNHNPAKNYGISPELSALIDSLVRTRKVILDLFGTPYIIGAIHNPENFDAIVFSYEDNPDVQQLSAELLFGGIPAMGHLPVSASANFPVRTGAETEATRWDYILPEEAAIHSSSLDKIDSIAKSGIAAGAYPGCQVLFARNGKVFYRRSFGSPVYGDTIAVRNDDLYDIASVTKVAATTLAVMKLYEEGKIDPDEKLGKYLPALKGSNKESLTIRDIMTHQAGLQPWIRFYEKTVKGGHPDTTIYHQEPSEEYPYRVAENMYIAKALQDTIYREIIISPVGPDKSYKYSDLGFYLLRLAIENITGQPFEDYLNETFYKPLGLTTMTFRPREQFPLGRIIPTENDTQFRMQLIHGDVHDQGAAMLGGVSGHAGLFSDANDLGIILQVLLNEGTYGGKRYFMPATVKEFTKTQFPGKGNRRGLGFDKPPITFVPDGPVCKSASPASFGHSGFTGTYIWADPENQLLYVFLSNRINPSSQNQKITEMNIRTKIHQEMYDILDTIQNKNK